MKRTNKEHCWNALKSWQKAMEKCGIDFGAKLSPLDPMAVLSKMTATQMQVVLSMVAASNHLGHDQSRKSRREFKARGPSFTTGDAFERRLNFKVINGGAA